MEAESYEKNDAPKQEQDFRSIKDSLDTSRNAGGRRRSRLGEMVAYRLSSKDVDAINRRRDQANASRAQHSATANGTMIHVGSKVNEGETYPMLIVRDWPNLPNVNGKVFLDGNDELWVQSVNEGPDPGQFLG